MAERIQARAIRRYGELLKQIEPGQGARDGKRHEGDLMPLNRTEAATQAGISEWQKVTAMRIANIPDPEFDALIESDTPPTVTKLAEIGKRQGQRTDLKVNEGQETLGEIPQNFAELPGKETLEVAATKAGFGNKETYRQAKAVVEKAAPELVAAMDAGTG